MGIMCENKVSLCVMISINNTILYPPTKYVYLYILGQQNLFETVLRERGNYDTSLLRD